MQSFNELKDDFMAYAKSQNLEGVAIDKLCNLLAYSAYKNQVLQVRNSVEASFSTSVSLNSRIHHAANYQYSVPRGRCPILSVNEITSIQTKRYNHLDYIMPFNGYYFYLYLTEGESYVKDVVAGEVVGGGLNLLCSSYPSRTISMNTSDSEYFVDFIGAENVSSDFLLYYGDDSGTTTLVNPSRITEDSSSFYYKHETGELDDQNNPIYDYEYDYLVLTLPSYGIRVIRHSDTASWEGSTMTLTYIPYNETSPDFTSLRAITGFTLVEDPTSSRYTTLDVIPFEARLESLDEIYANATASYLQQSSLVTPADLVIYLKKYYSQGIYKIYPDVKIEYIPGNETYISTDSATDATIVYSGAIGVPYTEIQGVVNQFKGNFSVTRNLTVVPSAPKSEGDSGSSVHVDVVAYSDSKTLTNDMLAELCAKYTEWTGENLNHSQFEADVVKLGFDYVKVYDHGTSTESTFNITCEDWEYPKMEAEVRS